MAIDDVTALPLAQLMSLKGRRAVVTGGGGGIGLAAARRLAEAGASVLIGDLDGDAAKREADKVAKELGATVIGHSLDVTSEQSIIAFADAAVSLLGGLDIWVNNAGIFPHSSITDMTVESWEQVQNVNLRGTFLGSREAVVRMRNGSTKKGVIINVASVAGHRGRHHLAHYSASKHGVIGLTRSLALELGQDGIRILAVAPGITSTPGLEQRGLSDDTKRRAAITPLGRVGVPDDVARVILFCALDMSSLMTGTTLFVDSGATA
jgi:NAD(P)-dependent dehydrogenase (short-subunit alcohol dehydrogenase family)